MRSYHEIGNYRLFESTAEEQDFYVSYMVEDIQTKQKYSAYLIHRGSLLYSSFSNNLHRILEIQASHKFPLIQNVKEVITKEDVLLIVFDLKLKGLLSLYQNGETILESQVQKLFYLIAQIIDYFHTRKIAILDIQPGSFYLTSTGLLKLSSFQYSGIFNTNEKTTQIPGNINFAAPEIFKGPYNPFAADIWSLGLTLYALLEGDTPIKGETVDEVKEQIMNLKSFKIPDYFGEKPADLLKKMLVIDPTKRATMTDVINHPFIQDIVLQSIINLKFSPQRVMERIKQFTSLKNIKMTIINDYLFKLKFLSGNIFRAIGYLSDIDNQTELKLVGLIVEKKEDFDDLIDAFKYLC